jgi:hypothetical protein
MTSQASLLGSSKTLTQRREATTTTTATIVVVIAIIALRNHSLFMYSSQSDAGVSGSMQQ